jgi:hypothetical protein
MRAVFLVMLLLVAGCAQRSPGTPKPDDTVMPADFAGTVSYANGTVPPPYHYEWTVTFDDSSAVVEWRPGYEEATEPWRETVDITDDQRSHLYGQLRDIGLFDMSEASDDGMVGGPGGHLEITARGKTYDPGSLGSSEDSARVLGNVADAVKELVPADVWDGLKAKQDDWSAQQPK